MNIFINVIRYILESLQEAKKQNLLSFSSLKI